MSKKQCWGSGSGVRDGCFFDPWIRDGRKSASGIRNEHPGSYFLELRNHFFDFFWVKIRNFFSDPGSGTEKSRIRDKHPGSIFLDNGKKNVTKQFQSWGFSIFLLVDGRIPTEPDPYR
jgi:hypothetical protein